MFPTPTTSTASPTTNTLNKDLVANILSDPSAMILPNATATTSLLAPFLTSHLRDPLRQDFSGIDPAIYFNAPSLFLPGLLSQSDVDVASAFAGYPAFFPTPFQATLAAAAASQPLTTPQLSTSGDVKYSRKVFVGGLPPDIDQHEIALCFLKFGPVVVDWPHKSESNSTFPPKGYAFLLFQHDFSVLALINSCIKEDDKLFLWISSLTVKEKLVQIRPWNLADSDCVQDNTQPLNPRQMIFVGGVPRPLKARELATIMQRLYGGVCYAGIETDHDFKYPKGAGKVAFSNQRSYIQAISARFVQLQYGEIDKRVEVKPYVMDDQMCDHCQQSIAPFFCADVSCLNYYCNTCWNVVHADKDFHKPLIKEGSDRCNLGKARLTSPLSF